MTETPPEPAENFDDLTPDRIIAAVETALQQPLRNVVLPLPSYINRVYELCDGDGGRLIAKFYRPNRWSRAALLEEHLYLLDCAAAEVPVVPPRRFPGGGTLRETDDGIFFAVFDKRGGRPLEIAGDDDWSRLGGLLGRLHAAGEQRTARHRLRLDPAATTGPEIEHLLASGLVGPAVRHEFEAAARLLYDRIVAGFEPGEAIRLHGDCHAGNILCRPDESPALIDFDDMMTGPPAQDLWLLLPGHVPECRRELALLLDAYRRFRDFPAREIPRMELLRGMRMLYFLDWCGSQHADYNFADRFPGWGGDAFWRREGAALRGQAEIIASLF